MGYFSYPAVCHLIIPVSSMPISAMLNKIMRKRKAGDAEGKPDIVLCESETRFHWFITAVIINVHSRRR